MLAWNLFSFKTWGLYLFLFHWIHLVMNIPVTDRYIYSLYMVLETCMHMSLVSITNATGTTD